MKTLKHNNLSALLIREKGCKFNLSCDFYSNSSYTCTHVGGRYCGKYRALLQKDAGEDRNLNKKAMIIA